MARCDNCLANKVCDHHRFGFENCGSYISAADVAPKSEVAREIFEEIDELLDFVGAMIGTKIIYCSKYAELKKKYTEGKKDDRQAYS